MIPITNTMTAECGLPEECVAVDTSLLCEAAIAYDRTVIDKELCSSVVHSHIYCCESSTTRYSQTINTRTEQQYLLLQKYTRSHHNLWSLDTLEMENIHVVSLSPILRGYFPLSIIKVYQYFLRLRMLLCYFPVHVCIKTTAPISIIKVYQQYGLIWSISRPHLVKAWLSLLL